MQSFVFMVHAQDDKSTITVEPSTAFSDTIVLKFDGPGGYAAIFLSRATLIKLHEAVLARMPQEQVTA